LIRKIEISNNIYRAGDHVTRTALRPAIRGRIGASAFGPMWRIGLML